MLQIVPSLQAIIFHKYTFMFTFEIQNIFTIGHNMRPNVLANILPKILQRFFHGVKQCLC